ncbi:hypothetical protein FIBSPDRAFT_943101 [Athelia psychrophila]|uniref:Uncharacterized protein n=1 Tax=Athelia psychrophila TaxID=1759441 RepID=A0A166WRH5_9AGAM|nr:hypothetical protein FIBSPDRAFT_943101 [Fibularhizoctonia sp. CBS 109695]
MREPLSYFEDVLLCTASTSLKSVWRLKQFVFADVGNTIDPIPVVAIDYGFANCKQPQEINDMKGAYRKFFEGGAGDPIGLRNAAIAGKVFEYVEGIVKLKKKFRHFMKSPHPLENLL